MKNKNKTHNAKNKQNTQYKKQTKQKLKTIIPITIPILLITAITTKSIAIENKIIINEETFSYINKEEKILSNFDSKYEITNQENTEKNNQLSNKLEKSITELTKKATYLLLGEPNLKNESSENYYKRHHDYLNLRYNPKVPKDSNTLTGLDEQSQEYQDDILSGISVPGMFLKMNELEIKYNSFGEIRISKIDDNNITSMITLSNVEMKEQDTENPNKYNIIQTNLNIYYYFKKLNNEYKLLYLYGETNDDIENYIDSNDEKAGEVSQNTNYNSDLRDIYNFNKADTLEPHILNNIYNENKNNVVFLNSTYNIGTVTSANGFFIKEGLIVTTYNYIEKSLIQAQNITISDSLGNVYELDGIVTMNIENDIAILKVKQQNNNYIKLEETNKPQKEDAVITLNTRKGIGLTTSKGIITLSDTNIQTSLPIVEETQGSPLFNSNGKLIGMSNSKTLNSSISSATNVDILKKYYNIFSKTDYDAIKSISFQKLKENYYIKYNEEKIINNIPENKWKEYSQVENINEMIELKLVKSFYKDGIISLRYKNEIQGYIDTMQFATKYMENLKQKGYKEKSKSDTKIIYENEKYQIVIMKEFNYLIIVMTET